MGNTDGEAVEEFHSLLEERIKGIDEFKDGGSTQIYERALGRMSTQLACKDSADVIKIIERVKKIVEDSEKAQRDKSCRMMHLELMLTELLNLEREILDDNHFFAKFSRLEGLALDILQQSLDADKRTKIHIIVNDVIKQNAHFLMVSITEMLIVRYKWEFAKLLQENIKKLGTTRLREYLFEFKKMKEKLETELSPSKVTETCLELLEFSNKVMLEIIDKAGRMDEYKNVQRIYNESQRYAFEFGVAVLSPEKRKLFTDLTRKSYLRTTSAYHRAFRKELRLGEISDVI